MGFASTLILLRALSTTCLISCCVVEIVLIHVMGMLTARLGAKPLHECGDINDDDGSFISILVSRVERDRFERDGHGQHADLVPGPQQCAAPLSYQTQRGALLHPLLPSAVQLVHSGVEQGLSRREPVHCPRRMRVGPSEKSP